VAFSEDLQLVCCPTEFCLSQSHPQSVNLLAGRSEVGLQLLLAIAQSLHLALARNVLTEQLQLVRLQPADLLLVPVEGGGGSKL
jgi:hypothetical protein